MPRSEAEILSALESAAEADRTGQSYHLPPAADAEPAPDSQEPTPTQEVPLDQGTSDEPDSFTEVDLSTLPPEVRAAAELHRRRMQADYTKKTTELADRQRELEHRFGDVELAEEAVRFYENLHTDPTFALDVAQRMIPALSALGMRDQIAAIYQQAGFSPAQAQAAAAQNVAEADHGVTPEDAEFWGFEDSPVDPRVDQLQAEVDAMKRYTQQQFQADQQQRLMLALNGELQRQENILVTERQYTDEHLEKLYNMAPAFGYNLIQTADYFDGLGEFFLSDYIGSKASNQTEPTFLPTGPGATATGGERERGSIDEARERAIARLRGIGA